MSLNIKIVLIILLIAVTGCSDRSEKFLDGYAEVEIIELGAENYNPENQYEYLDSDGYKNTNEAIKNQLATLKGQSEATKALANIYKTTTIKKAANETAPEYIKQCIIVHRPDMTQTTLTHELGHCFHMVYSDVLKKKAPELLRNIESQNEQGRFLLESFAEIVAGTVAFDIDGDHSYLINRIKKLENYKHSADIAPYLHSLPLMKLLPGFLDKSELPSKHDEQVRFILDNFYLNPEFNRALKLTMG